MRKFKTLTSGKLQFSRLLVFATFLLAFNSAVYSQITAKFFYAGGVQTFTVPCGVFVLHVKAWGAGGSGGGADDYGGAVGGAGAFVGSDLAVVPGQVITVILGGGAGPGGNHTSWVGGGASGWGNGLFAGGAGGNSGGSGSSGGGGGGGGGVALYAGSTLLLVAGGGGGGSGGGQYSSGATGGGGGVNGNSSPGSCASPGLIGASINGNGIVGANKGGADGGGGGGGGGGYLGGGGGGVAGGCDCGACGGAGGTSWSSGTNIVILNGSGQTPGNGADPDLPAGVAAGGGTSTQGGPGFLEFTYLGGPPHAVFRSNSVCSGIATQFTDSSYTLAGTIVARSWDFGDGSPLNNTTNPSHLYPSGGIYNAMLVSSNSFGCNDTLIKQVHVYYNPVAGFTHADVCKGDTMHFTNTSTVNNTSSITGYLWQFGDASPTNTLQTPKHYYSTAGTFAVTLVTTTADGCTDAANASVKTFDAPSSAFAFNSICLYDSAHFVNNTVSPSMGSTANWSWSFGDGSSLNTAVWSPSHKYAVPGNYQVTLITHSSNLGCADTITHPITAFPVPVARFVFNNICLNQATNFIDSSIVSSGSIAGHNWNFGDGTSPNANPSPSHTYANKGTYNVSLIVTTNNGCKDTVAKNSVVHPLPHVKISAANVCDGTTVVFNDSTSIFPSDTLHSWSWNFADNSPLNTNRNTSHLYAAAGSYPVKLYVVSNFGCIDSLSKNIVVNPNPVVDFRIDDSAGCAPLCVNFTNIPSAVPGTNAAWSWNFGDGSALGNVQNPNKCYIDTAVFSPAVFNVILKVTSDSGCISIKTKNNYITVYPNPHAVFAVDPGTTTIIDPVITIKDESTGTDSWKWDFGDQLTSTSSNPSSHTYADTGTYKITLVTSTQYHCADTTSKTVIIEPDFVLYIPKAFSPNGDDINDIFTCKGIFVKEYEMSIFDRWGNLIFLTDDINKGWDGKAKASNVDELPDVYVYEVKITDIRLKKHSYKGIVTLIR